MFEREFGGMRLTSEGADLLPYMQRLLQEERMVGEQIDRINGLETGHIKLISFTTAAVCFLPDILEGFREEYPGIEIELSPCEPPTQAIEKLVTGEADCAFLAATESDRVEIHKLREERNLVVVSESHPLAKKKVVPLKELEKYPYLSSIEEDYPQLYEMLQAQGIKLNRTMTVNNDYGCFSMVSRNLGITIYTESLVKNSMFPVIGIPLDKKLPIPVSLGFKSYQKLSVATKAFVDYVLDLNIDKW